MCLDMHFGQTRVANHGDKGNLPANAEKRKYYFIDTSDMICVVEIF